MLTIQSFCSITSLYSVSVALTLVRDDGFTFQYVVDQNSISTVDLLSSLIESLDQQYPSFPALDLSFIGKEVNLSKIPPQLIPNTIFSNVTM